VPSWLERRRRRTLRLSGVTNRAVKEGRVKVELTAVEMKGEFEL
jgi:hypothetical protein